MTGFEIFNKALKLLNYVTAEGTHDSTLTLRAITAINTVYSDIYYMFNDSGFTPINNLTETINLSEKILNDVFPYGVAMHLAIGEGDSLNQQVFGNIYNSKRVGLSFTTKIKDSLPKI